MTVITRFAPSPTGSLHIGGARTALFNYLFARHHQGKFLLRIEDTDRERSTAKATEEIMSSMQWLEREWDSEIIYQSMRAELYREAALELLRTGKAYYCFASQEEIAEHRTYNQEQNPVFISPWRDADPSTYPVNIKPVIRLKVDRSGSTVINDYLQGDIIIKNIHLDDMVLLRSDGTATYMLAVVVDDHDMAISHTIRGDDHLTNAARQIQLYKAFRWQVPIMVHIPLIHGSDGAKLSKRHAALGVDEYKKMGYLPEALCNYLLRLGWSHGDDEIISREEAIKWFNLDSLGLSPARLDSAKMQFINAYYLRRKDKETLTQLIMAELQKEYEISAEEQSYIHQAINSIKERAELLTELVSLAKIYLISQPILYSAEALDILNHCNKDYIAQVIAALREIPNSSKDAIQRACKDIAIKNHISLGELMSPIRALMTGLVSAPSIFEIISIIGINNSVKRLEQIF